MNRRRSTAKCIRGYKRCPHYAGIGGFECVDIDNDPESCGGCVGFDFVRGDAGQDCTDIPNVSVVKCVSRKCMIETCRKGYTRSADGKSCLLTRSLQVQHVKKHHLYDVGSEL